MKKEIIVDLDGVFFDWHKSFENIVKETHKNYNTSMVRTYDFNKSLSELPRLELIKHFPLSVVNDIYNNKYESSLGVSREFLFSQIGNPRVYAEAPIFEGAYEGVKKLLDSDEFKVIFNTATGVSNSSEIAKIKIDLLHNLYPDYELNIQVTLGREKPVFHNAFAVIDDSLDHLCQYNNFSALLSIRYAFLINHSFNQEVFNPRHKETFMLTTRVKSLAEAVDIILKGEN